MSIYICKGAAKRAAIASVRISLARDVGRAVSALFHLQGRRTICMIIDARAKVEASLAYNWAPLLKNSRELQLCAAAAAAAAATLRFAPALIGYRVQFSPSSSLHSRWPPSGAFCSSRFPSIYPDLSFYPIARADRSCYF